MAIAARISQELSQSLHRFLISWGKLGNRCKDFSGNNPKSASILDFRARLGNRCKDFPGNNPKSASILDFRARLGNRCKETCGRRRFLAFTYISCLSGEQQAQIIVSNFFEDSLTLHPSQKRIRKKRYGWQMTR